MIIYNKATVYEFLKKEGYAFAAGCLLSDFYGETEVMDLKLMSWFQNYFPRGKSYNFYKKMQCEVVGFIPLEKE